MMSVIGLINMSTHAFYEYGWEWVKITGFTWERHYYLSQFSDCGWLKQCELRIHFQTVSIYNVWSKICESGMDETSFVFKMTRKRVTQWFD